MHQDEENQAAQPEQATQPEINSLPLQSELTEPAASPEAPANATDPALASATEALSEAPEPSQAGMPVDAPDLRIATAVEADAPAFGESLYAKPAWMAAGEPHQPAPEVITSEDVILPVPGVTEPALYTSTSWSVSEAHAPAASFDTPADTENPVPLPPPVPPSWQTSAPAEGAESYATDEATPPPPVWVTPPLTDAAPVEGATETPTYERPAEPHIEMPQGGPNWMLAFVCGWAAFTAFMEAPVAYAAKETMVNGTSVTLTAGDRLYGGLGFGLLGLGLLLFGIEALLWGRRRRGASALLSIGLPVLVSLAGVVCLVLSHYPGSRI